MKGENMENLDGIFYTMLSGMYSRNYFELLECNNDIVLSYDYDLLDNIGHIVVTAENNTKTRFEAPRLSRCSGSGPVTAQRAATNQRIISMWLKLLGENMEFFANSCIGKHINIHIRETLIYKNYMYWVSRNLDEMCVYIHPYVKKHYPSDYKEIKKLKEQEGYNVCIGIFENTQKRQFEQLGIDYLKLKEEEL